MPPQLTWFAGRQTVLRFLASQVFAVLGPLRMVPVMANGQPAFAAYQREPDGIFHAHEVLVPTVTAIGVARIVVFLDPGLVTAFGLPRGGGGRVTQATPQVGPRRLPDLRLVYIGRPPIKGEVHHE